MNLNDMNDSDMNKIINHLEPRRLFLADLIDNPIVVAIISPKESTGFDNILKILCVAFENWLFF